MGSGLGAICKQCGHAFGASEGGGFEFHLLHCEACGGTKQVWFDEIGGARPQDQCLAARWVEHNVTACGCGGRFTLEAKDRCTKCGSDDYERDPNAQRVMYD